MQWGEGVSGAVPSHRARPSEEMLVNVCEVGEPFSTVPTTATSRSTS